MINIKIMSADEAYKLTQSYIEKNEIKQEGINTVVNYIESCIKEACKNNSTTAQIDFKINSSENNLSYRTLKKVVDFIREGTQYIISNYTEKMPNGSKYISFSLSWDKGSHDNTVEGE